MLRAAAVLCVAAAATAALLYVGKWEKMGNSADVPDEADDDRPEYYYNGAWYTQNTELETLLIAGIDKYSDQLAETLELGKELGTNINTQQSDFLMLLVLDRERNVCKVLPLNRDTMTQINAMGMAGESIGSFTGQLALAHTYGSGGVDSGYNTVQAVSDLLYGVEIDHFVTLTMDAVAVLNDLVGGVTVLVEDDFSEVTDRLPQGQEVHLTGDLALTFVRTRRWVADQTNLNRMARQKIYLEALYEKMKAEPAEAFSAKALLELSPYLVSDCSATTLAELYQEVLDSQLTVLDTPEGEVVRGEKFMEFYPDEQKLQRLGKNQVLNAHNFSLLVLSNFDKPIWPPSYPMVGSLCIFLFSSPCSALLTPSPFECPLCWFLPVTRSVRSLAGTPGT